MAFKDLSIEKQKTIRAILKSMVEDCEEINDSLDNLSSMLSAEVEEDD